jgi:hypothetical protein
MNACTYVYVHTLLWEKKALVGDKKVSLYVRSKYMYTTMHLYISICINVYVCIYGYTVMGEKSPSWG